jgi:hypothetical protein
MKTTHLLILVAFALSVGFNVYSFNSGGEPVSPCDNNDRYKNEVAGGGKEVDVSWLEPLVTSYRNAHKDDKTPYKTTGFILSKRVFDELFTDGNVNALSLNLIDNDGQLNLAVKAINTTKTQIEKKDNTGVYILQSFCPDDCSAW